MQLGTTTSHSFYIMTGGSNAIAIDSSQRVGIGTPSPSGKLSVSNSGACGIELTPYSTYTEILSYNRSTSAYVPFTSFASTHTWNDGNGERLRIDSSGHVGIGTSSPNAILHVVGSSGSGVIQIGNAVNTQYHYINFGGSAATNDAWQLGRSPSGGVGPANGFYLYDLKSSETRLVVDTSGRVGIGTTSPGTLLHIKQDDANGPTIQLENNAQSVYLNNWGSTGGGGNRTNRLEVNAAATGYAAAICAASQIEFHIGGTNNEKARIDSSGRLLVGTSSTSGNIAGNDKLAVVTTGEDTKGGISVTDYAGVTSTVGSYAALRLQRSLGTTDGSFTALTAANWGLGRIEFNGSNGVGFGTGATIEGVSDALAWGNGDHPARLVFSTTADGASSPTERMRITNAGEFRMFSGNLSYTLVLGNATTAGTSYIFLEGRHTATDNSGGTGTRSFLVTTNGNVTNTNGSYGTISDVKLKENIVNAGSQWNDFKAIQIRNWNFKAETGHETHRQIGPIAQELETVCPGLVFETPDRDEDGNETGEVTKGVNQSVLYMKAVKALQEAMERIETLEGMVAVNNITIDEQQHQLSTLAARLTALESA
jgi:hypothetical protein